MRKKTRGCKKRIKTQWILGFILISFLSVGAESKDSDPKSAEPKENAEVSQKNGGLSSDQIEKKRNIIVQMLKFGSTQERSQALQELERFPKEESQEIYKLIGKILQEDPDWMMKVYCLRAIGNLDLTQFSDGVIESLDNPVMDVQRQAIFTVSKLKLEKAGPKLLELLKQQDFTKNSNLTTSLIQTLTALNSREDAVGFLKSKFAEKYNSPELRAQIALLFGKSENPSLDAILIQAAEDDTEEILVRSYAITALGSRKSEQAIPVLHKILEGIRKMTDESDLRKNQPIKVRCMATLVTLGDKEVLQDLFSYARDNDPMVRLRAIRELAKTKDPEAKEMLEYKAKRDPSVTVRRAAEKALENWEKDSKDSDEENSDQEEKP